MTHVEKVMTEYGFAFIQSGDNCTAYRKDNLDGSYFLVTNESGLHAPEEPNETILVCYCESADDELSCDSVSFDEFERHFMI